MSDLGKSYIRLSPSAFDEVARSLSDCGLCQIPGEGYHLMTIALSDVSIIRDEGIRPLSPKEHIPASIAVGLNGPTFTVQELLGDMLVWPAEGGARTAAKNRAVAEPGKKFVVLRLVAEMRAVEPVEIIEYSRESK